MVHASESWTARMLGVVTGETEETMTIRWTAENPPQSPPEHCRDDHALYPRGEKMGAQAALD